MTDIYNDYNDYDLDYDYNHYDDEDEDSKYCRIKHNVKKMAIELIRNKLDEEMVNAFIQRNGKLIDDAVVYLIDDCSVNDVDLLYNPVDYATLNVYLNKYLDFKCEYKEDEYENELHHVCQLMEKTIGNVLHGKINKTKRYAFLVNNAAMSIVKYYSEMGDIDFIWSDELLESSIFTTYIDDIIHLL